MTFEWDNIAGKVLFAAYREGDMITALTNDGREYLVELNEHDGLEKEREILERFLGERMNFNECDDGSEKFRETERWLYKWLPFAYIFVKKDFFERFSEEFEKQSVKRYLTALDASKRLLDPNNELPRLIIRQQRLPKKWEALTFEQQALSEIDEMLKKTECELLKNKQNYISFDEFKAQSKAHLEAMMNEHKEPEPVILKFEWENITEDVIKRFVFVEFKRVDIYFPCCIHAITGEGLEYFAELDECKKEDDVLELFLGENTEQYTMPKDTKGFRVSGKWLYDRISGSQIFVRADFFDRFISEYEKRNKDRYSALKTARKLLNPECKQPRMIHSQTLAKWEL